MAEQFNNPRRDRDGNRDRTNDPIDRHDYSDVRFESRGFFAPLRRVSWGAIFAGVVVIVFVETMLGLLGMGIGLSTIDVGPGEGGDQNIGGLSIAAMIWWLISTVIAVYLGAWVTAKLSGVVLKFNGALHGLVSFGLATVFTLFMMTTVAGAIMGGALGVVQTGVNAAAMAASGNADEFRDVINDNTRGTVSRSNINNDVSAAWADIRNEVTSLWNRATNDNANTTPSSSDTSSRSGSTATTGRLTTNGTTQANRGMESQQFLTLLQASLNRNYGQITEDDKDSVVNVIVARTGMSRTQAEAQVDRWAASYNSGNQANQQPGVTGTTNTQAREVADDAIAIVSGGALWGFFMMLLGAGAALLGGAAGSPARLVDVSEAPGFAAEPRPSTL